MNSSTNEWFHINFHHLSSHSLLYFVSFAIPHTVHYWIKKPYSFARPRAHYSLVVFFLFSQLSHRIILTLIHHLEYFIPSFSRYPSFFFALSFSFFFSLLFSIFCGWNILSVFFFLFRRCWIRLCTCNLCINKTPFNIVRSLHRFIAI